MEGSRFWAWAVSCLLVYKVLGNTAAANKQSNEMANAFFVGCSEAD